MRVAAVALFALFLNGCAGDGHGAVDPLSGDPTLFTWQLPAGLSPPVIPADNPMSAAKVELGRRLFYDVRLSGNGAFACSSCHRQELAFSDAKNIPVGTTGEAHTRNSIGLANAGYQRTFGWAGPETRSLEAQALIPMFGDVPVELGLKGREQDLLARLRAEPVYQRLFPKSFPAESDPFTVPNVTKALAAFQRTFVSYGAPLDRYRRGDRSAMSAAALRGQQLFGDRGCSECHSGTMFTVAVVDPGGVPGPPPAGRPADFANTGLYNVGGTGAYPTRNGGLFETTHLPSDMGKMKVPSLRNVAVTFPYMHDGSVGTLDDVVAHYARGGRLITIGPNAGDGRVNPNRDRRITGFAISAQEKADLVAFLRSLTDSTFITDRRFSNPWR
ncbi:MAG: MbnH family di-heme enzyme [Gemmatimonadaceae bacterium]